MPIIQSVDRALQILDLFDEYTTELKMTEISRRLDLHKSTLHSLLKTLMQHDYISQNQDTGKYRLGLALVEKGQRVLQSLDVRAVARRHLLALSASTGQTAHLVILDHREGVYIDKVEGEKAVIRYSRLGGRVPLHCSAVGKVLMAFQPEDKREQLLEGYAFEPHTPFTITDRGLYERELANVRERGYALDHQENERGVGCAAAPVFGHTGEVIAAISLSAMLSRVDDEEFEQYADLVKKEARLISELLGYRAPFERSIR